MRDTSNTYEETLALAKKLDQYWTDRGSNTHQFGVQLVKDTHKWKVVSNLVDGRPPRSIIMLRGEDLIPLSSSANMVRP
jgi:hypothetical protein